MKFRRAATTLLIASVLASCGPSGGSQTVGFVLDIGSKKLDRIAFRVKHSTGDFLGEDGGCTPGALVTPAEAVAVRDAGHLMKASGDGTAVVAASTSSTSTSTTTTSTIPVTYNCTIIFRLNDAATFGALQWETNYTASGGDFDGTAAAVACRPLTSGVLTAVNDNDTGNTLDTGLVAVSGYSGPADLTECDFTGPRVPAKADFAIAITEAVSVDFDPLVPEPVVAVKSIVCAGPPTTTTTTTTTTLPVNPCGDGVLGAGEECDDGNRISGDGCAETCKLEDTFASAVAAGELNVNIVHQQGIAPGAALAYCKFNGEVTSSTFKISVTSCSLDNSDGCNPTSDATVKVSTTTTTTSTTVTTTSTTDTTTTTLR